MGGRPQTCADDVEAPNRIAKPMAVAIARGATERARSTGFIMVSPMPGSYPSACGHTSMSVIWRVPGPAFIHAAGGWGAAYRAHDVARSRQAYFFVAGTRAFSSSNQLSPT